MAEIAQGRVWSGISAKEIGLVDELGGLETAIDYLDDKLELNDNYQVVSYPSKLTFEAELLKRLGGANIEINVGNQELLKQLVKQYYSDLEIQEMLNNPYQIYSILPYKLKIE